MDSLPPLLSGEPKGREHRGLPQREGLVGAVLPPRSRARRMAISLWKPVLGLLKPRLLSGLSIWIVSQRVGLGAGGKNLAQA